MSAAADSAVRVSSEDLIAYKDAVRRLKQSADLFKRADYGVVFTGRSLFRATIALPATVPVGPLTARDITPSSSQPSASTPPADTTAIGSEGGSDQSK